MTTTINISLPKNMYKDAKQMVSKRGYSSISELVRDALRHVLYPTITENGFTPEFEEEVLKAAAEPKENDVLMRNEKDIDAFFDQLDKEINAKKAKHGKHQ